MGQANQMRYDLGGRMIEHVDNDGVTIRHTYDPMGELIGRQADDEAAETAERSPGGKRIRYEDLRGVETWQYTVRKRVSRHVTADGDTIDWNYDLHDRVISREDPTGETSFEYDAIDRLIAVRDPDGGLTTYTYNLAGSQETVTYANGVQTHYEFNNAQQLTRTWSEDDQGNVLTDFHYTLAPAGNRTRVEELHSGRTVDYSYDGLYRLTAERIEDAEGAVQTIEYTYDAVGNRLTKNDSEEGLTEYSYDANDRLVTQGAVTHEYNERGDLVSTTRPDGEVSYVYDAWRRLVSVEDGGLNIDYVYDMDGNRVERTVGAETRRYLYDTGPENARIIRISDAADQEIAHYTHGHDLLSQTREGATHFYLYDGNLNTRGMADEDGAVAATYDYDAFGNPLAETGNVENEFRYNGEYVDANTGFVYLRARWLNPSQGRFMSHDPKEGMPFDPPSLHRYTYAGNDPVNRSDPSGEFSLISISTASAISGHLRSIYTSNLIKTFLKVQRIAFCVLKPAYAEMNMGMEMAISGLDGGWDLYASGRQKVAGAFKQVAAALGEFWQNVLDDMFKFEFKISWEIDLKIGTLSGGGGVSCGAGSGCEGSWTWADFKPAWKNYAAEAEAYWKKVKDTVGSVSAALAGDVCEQSKIIEALGNKLVDKMPNF